MPEWGCSLRCLGKQKGELTSCSVIQRRAGKLWLLVFVCWNTALLLVEVVFIAAFVLP